MVCTQSRTWSYMVPSKPISWMPATTTHFSELQLQQNETMRRWLHGPMLLLPAEQAHLHPFAESRPRPEGQQRSSEETPKSCLPSRSCIQTARHQKGGEAQKGAEAPEASLCLCVDTQGKHLTSRVPSWPLCSFRCGGNLQQ